jgi:hypothetical protein
MLPRKQKPTHESVAKAALDGPGIDAAMKRAVSKALEEHRKLGQPIVTASTLGRGGNSGK